MGAAVKMRLAPLNGLLWFWTTLRDISLEAKLLLVAISLSKLAVFMVWPFLTVTMNQRFGTSITEIGAQFTLAGIVALLVAPLAGGLADRFKRPRLLALLCTVSLGGFALPALWPTEASYMLAVMVIATAGGMIEPLLRSALGDCARTDAGRPILFHLRYYSVNLAVAIGPLLGMGFADRQSDLVFLAAALAFLILGISVLYADRVARPAEPAPTLWALLPALLKHRHFRAIFIANFLLVLIYAQIDEPLTFYLVTLSVPDLTRLIVLINLTNTVMVLGFHLLFMRWLIALPEHRAFALALVSLMGAQAIIAANSAAIPTVWLLAIACATLAEMIAMPLFSTIIDRMAPPESRNSYFGVYLLSNGGASLAPMMGALVISLWGGPVLFTSMALICLPLAALGFRLLSPTVAPAPGNTN